MLIYKKNVFFWYINTHTQVQNTIMITIRATVASFMHIHICIDIHSICYDDKELITFGTLTLKLLTPGWADTSTG